MESRERSQPPGQAGEVVDVDIPAVASVFEKVVHWDPSRVGEGGEVDRGCQHGATASRRVAAGQSAPSRRAARSPDAAPSSWNPQPWYAPANTTRSSSRAANLAWAAM